MEQIIKTVIVVVFSCVIFTSANSTEIYVDDIWITDDTDITLIVTDLTEEDVFDVEAVADLVLEQWKPIYRFCDGYGYGYGYGYGFSYSISFGYGYAYGYGGYGYRPILLWTSSYTNSNRLFYRIKKY